MDIFAQIKQKVDIVDLIKQNIELKKSGKNYLGLCPFHNDSKPSFYVSKEKKIYTCFSCKATGDAISFVARFNDIAQIDAAKKINEDFDLKIKFKADPNDHLFKAVEAEHIKYVSGLQEHHIKYLKGRGIEEETIKELGIGGDRNWVCLPIRDERGRVLGFNKRNTLAEADQKYWHSEESPIFKKNELVTGLWESRKLKQNTIIITEGQIDTYLAKQAGFAAVSCLTSKISTEQVDKILNKFNNIQLAFDNDEAGIEATIGAYKMFKLRDPHVTIKVVDLGKFKDLAERLELYDSLMLENFFIWAYNNCDEDSLLELLAYESKHIEIRRAAKLLADKMGVNSADIFHDVLSLRINKLKLKSFAIVE